MSKKQDRNVYKRSDGKWVNKRQDATRASSVHNTQKAAVASARKHLNNQAGGEVTIHGVDGKIRQKNTIAPGKDPYPPKG